jgi:hypothetical protein
LIAYLTFRAYRDGEFCSRDGGRLVLMVYLADTLDRFEVPFFGRLASNILDDE